MYLIHISSHVQLLNFASSLIFPSPLSITHQTPAGQPANITLRPSPVLTILCSLSAVEKATAPRASLSLILVSVTGTDGGVDGCRGGLKVLSWWWRMVMSGGGGDGWYSLRLCGTVIDPASTSPYLYVCACGRTCTYSLTACAIWKDIVCHGRHGEMQFTLVTGTVKRRGANSIVKKLPAAASS